ncbi:DUF928 domain-containing protein [Synechocystis sp. PCC 7509]|uniref:DUF928 domain-containing protein n=1 Tax=Synechocystis sp. PCC 7509 TaxID=927677 RepID=UPI0002ACEB81|nr:DUF928 domain-containing protein [Synechocystis sp. PCC 7509]
MKLAMENMNQVCAFAKRALGTIVLVLISTSYITEAKAQKNSFDNFTGRSLRQVESKPVLKPQKTSPRVGFVQPKFPSSGAPSGRQRGAAGRGNCLNNVKIPLTALVPTITKSVSNRQSAIVATQVWGLTVKEHPTFLFYVPYTQISAAGEFVLQDSDDNDIYRAPVSLPEVPGIVRVQLPPDSTPLAVDKMYHWYFKVRCAQGMASPVFVEGWVQRINLNSTVADQIATAITLQQVALYAKNGIWYDTVALLAQMRLQNMEDAASKADWYNLLETIDLSTLASESIKSMETKDQKSLVSTYNP